MGESKSAEEPKKKKARVVTAKNDEPPRVERRSTDFVEQLSHVDSLVEQVVAAASESQMLRHEVGDLKVITQTKIDALAVNRASDRRITKLLVVLVMLVALLLAGLLTLGILNRKTIHRINDCTTPTSKCAASNSASTLEAVEELKYGQYVQGVQTRNAIHQTNKQVQEETQTYGQFKDQDASYQQRLKEIQAILKK